VPYYFQIVWATDLNDEVSITLWSYPRNLLRKLYKQISRELHLFPGIKVLMMQTMSKLLSLPPVCRAVAHGKKVAR